jgi:hypothetical protein
MAGMPLALFRAVVGVVAGGVGTVRGIDPRMM